jgi:hypothetical protein
MRSLELHVIESETDIQLALSSGVLLPEQMVMTECSDCEDLIGLRASSFEPFVVVIDEHDQDWTVCGDCARPIVDYVNAYFPPTVESYYLAPFIDEELDPFD